MRTLFLVVAGMLISFAAKAAPANQASVEALLSLANTESTLEIMYANLEESMRAGMQQSMAGRTLTEAQQKQFDAIPKEFVRVIRDEMGWQILKPDFIKIYSDVFTQEEVDGLINFYRSPIGRAFIDKTPVVLQMTMSVTQSRLQSFLPKMEAAMKKAVDDIERAK